MLRIGQPAHGDGRFTRRELLQVGGLGLLGLTLPDWWRGRDAHKIIAGPSKSDQF